MDIIDSGRCLLESFSYVIMAASLALFFFFFLISSVIPQNTLTSPVDVARAAATARTNSPTSNVVGKAFDRIAIIWLENTDYAKAAGDRKLVVSFFRFKKLQRGRSFNSIVLILWIAANLAYLAAKGIKLSNYLCVLLTPILKCE